MLAVHHDPSLESAASETGVPHNPLNRTRGNSPIPSTTAGINPNVRITLNFRDAPIDRVLEHLSSAAGFINVKDAPVDGRVTVCRSLF